MKNKTNQTANRTLSYVAAAVVLTLFAVEPALAQGGLQKVNTFMDNVLAVLRGISVTAVTIAIMWAGYKFLFKHADIGEIAKILGGGLLIGGASELARYLLT
ncbi:MULTISPECIES: TrbC/VirB2 family protein [Pseudomonas syringae group]|uniref:VirB2 n=1 Tax=Pseudomonas syringae pv. persicae TaxID=237306 RepID=A0A3M4AI08_9PSED|nr:MULTISPECIES: TrbC/VirB2 family protein [Pseudomonas syringae group]QOQ33524.1 Major pilus subunit of type IV secretion complex, VirB2 [Pseudomonas syringae pv. actinidiae]RMP06558.1 hypothetical protein ALQ30_200293 [Pseudomonas syringae pv. persicae]